MRHPPAHALTLLLLCLLPLTLHSAPLPPMHALPLNTSVSGISSGGFMASQYHIARSSQIIGAGIIAAGPWNCIASQPLNRFRPALLSALSTCMKPCKYNPLNCNQSHHPNSTHLLALAQQAAKEKMIDPLKHLKQDRIYLFSGTNDLTVDTAVADSVAKFYTLAGTPNKNIHYDRDTPAGHGFITDKASDLKCEKTAPPFFNNCGFSQASRVLSQIYGPLNPSQHKPRGTLLAFDQRPYASNNSGLADDGYLYVPNSCTHLRCRLHIVFHGCKQSASQIGLTFIQRSGYNTIADNNQLLILYPQIEPSFLLPFNPQGCWDFWGYSNLNIPPYDFHLKQGLQNSAIYQMSQQLSLKP